MEPMEDENCEEEFIEVFNTPTSAEDLKFDTIISGLQEVVISPEFENTLSNFMRNHWHIFNQSTNKDAELKVFHLYRAELQKYLQTHIAQTVPDFDWAVLGQLLQTRRERVDEMILDTLLSLEEVDSFKLFIKDYRHSYEEEEMFKVLTIKSNKIPENKKVKGKDNIFANDGQGMFDKGGLKALPKKKQSIEKTQSELMVPDMILTVKPMRKQ